MKPIDVCHYSVTFDIQTEHGSNLEFVLTDAMERNGGRNYLDLLWDALDEALKRTRIYGAEIVERTLYGHVSFRLNVLKQEDLPGCLKVCSNAAQAWAKRYRVNSMRSD